MVTIKIVPCCQMDGGSSYDSSVQLRELVVVSYIEFHVPPTLYSVNSLSLVWDDLISIGPEYNCSLQILRFLSSSVFDTTLTFNMI